MRVLTVFLASILSCFMCSCSKTLEESTNGDSMMVISHLKATASNGASPFDGIVDQQADLENLTAVAWGNGRWGLHRGHSPILNVLEAFLGIDHKQMHVYMDSGQNLAALCHTLNLSPDDLIESLMHSFAPYIEEGVRNGVITEVEAGPWLEQLRKNIRKRVYWDGDEVGV